ncbi:hypothetical protein BRL53_05275 [Corynebacterium ulcerans]|uniref:hypothetical protein n=1 Tax=Corynebacterium ulcerans TaxID=65058 RepID=UPI000C75A8C7|nr:hypothetical protein [Corynebacterium ulcerans]PLW00146.1 hypothetical protein BRL53_05275 [Corynebacterium ulcerans]
MTNPMGRRKAARAISSTRETHITPTPIGIKKLTIRMDSTLHTQLKTMASKKEITMAELVNGLIESYLERES